MRRKTVNLEKVLTTVAFSVKRIAKNRVKIALSLTWNRKIAMSILPQNKDEKEIKEYIETLSEKYYIEMKRAESNLPSTFWETYSAFANTNGGLIVLGVVESPPRNKIVGVANPAKILSDLWNILSNQTKVNYQCVNNEDIQQIEIDGKKLILIKINEAPENKKPIFLNGKLENAYIRTGEGDRKITHDQLRSFLKNASPTMDSLFAPNYYTMDDLDLPSITSFKEKVTIRYPRKQFTRLSPEEFLKEIGAVSSDRETKELKIKQGTLLFFGKYNSIRELFPNFHLDFFNRKGNNPRWEDRVATDEPSNEEMNIYNFYTIVSEKLRVFLQKSFALDTQNIRVPESNFDETIREALVNCLAHADYWQAFPSIKIEAHEGWFSFLNPGKMLISIESFANGGNSRPRNESIMSFFRHLGVSERQGFGGAQIFRSAVENQFRLPEIETDLERTEVRIWYIDLADSYPDMSEDEKSIFRYLVKKGIPVTNKELQAEIGLSAYHVRKALTGLLNSNHIDTSGKARATKYSIKIGSQEMFARLHLAIVELGKVMEASRKTTLGVRK
mgnify:CR=1 FL=1